MRLQPKGDGFDRWQSSAYHFDPMKIQPFILLRFNLNTCQPILGQIAVLVSSANRELSQLMIVCRPSYYKQINYILREEYSLTQVVNLEL